MPTAPEENKPANPEETLKRIHANLKDAKAQTRLNAIQELLEQKFSSPAILRTLEQLALKDKSNPVREAAHQALNSPTHRYIQGRIANLKQKDRRAILNEIKSWEKDGLLQDDQAEVLRQRYDFDLKPTTPPPAPQPAPVKEVSAAPKPEPVAPPKATPVKESLPATPIEKQPTKPRPSLTQTLLSETSIKIALYLGAFFVIAAAAILAAVVEIARLPILFIATALFAGGALLTRKKLPQPSFTLFVVFSFLLPTDANVLADVLNLSAHTNAGFWFAIMLLLALTWGFGTWFYNSRLFSLAAFIALINSTVRLGEFFEAEPEINLLLIGLAVLIGLGGVYILKRWQSAKFSLPLFILVQIAQLGLNVFAIIAVLSRIDDFPATWNLVNTFFWLATAGFYVLSDLLFPFVLFPWLAAAVLYPVPLIFIFSFNTDPIPVAITTWIFGALLTTGSEFLRRIQSDKIHRYALPVLTTSFLGILTALLVGFIENNTWGFIFLFASALLYTVLQVLKPRVYIWVTTLLLAIGAYFTFFALPFMEKLDVYNGYRFLGASMLMLLPDLFLIPDFSAHKGWRWPLRILGIALTFLSLSFLLFPSTTNAGHAAITFAIYTIFFVVYALRYKKTVIGYVSTASAAMTVILALQYFDLDTWLPALTGLAAAYYLGGYILFKRDTGTWSGMMRTSALILGALTAMSALFDGSEFSGWYILLVGVLFTVEMFIRGNGWFEAGPAFFFPAALVMLLWDFDVEGVGYYLLGASLLWLSLDLGLMQVFHGKRPLTWVVIGLAGLSAAFSLFEPQQYNGWLTLLVGIFFSLEMFTRKNGWLEAGLEFFFPAALVLLLWDFDVKPVGYYLLSVSLLWLTLDLVLERVFTSKRPLTWLIRGLGTLAVASNVLLLLFGTDSARVAWICFGSYTLFFIAYSIWRKKAMFGYAFTVFIPLTIWYLLRDLKQDNWLLPMMTPALVYYLIGFVLTRREKLLSWGQMLRFSGLGLASIVSLSATITSQDGNGWYALITATLFAIEMFSRNAGFAEAGIQLFFATGVFTLLGEADIAQSYQWLGVSLTLLGTDLALARTYTGNRPLEWVSRGLGALFVVFNTLDILFSTPDAQISAICFAIYTLFFLIQALLYRLPILGYGFSLYSVLTIITTLNAFKQEHWLLPVTALAIIFYVIGFFLRKHKPEITKTDLLALEWPFVLWTSGLGIGLLVTAVAPVQGGLEAAIPVAVTATMVAVEAFDRRNIWLGFPANALYLMAYFILLIELKVDEPQFFSIATAALGLLMHYLLTRAGSRTGAFITGMVSQLVLLGTTYIQFLSTERLLFFVVMFFQALVVLVYGVIVRSRSLVITPIIFSVLSVLTVLYGLLEGILPVLLIGCTGVILLMLGIFAVIMRDRLKQISERFNDWGA